MSPFYLKTTQYLIFVLKEKKQSLCMTRLASSRSPHHRQPTWGRVALSLPAGPRLSVDALSFALVLAPPRSSQVSSRLGP